MSLKKDIKECIEVLKNGGVILYPTDTVWGLGCDATNENAVAKIYALKKRDEKKAMIILLQESSKVKEFAKEPNKEVLSILKKSERPTTIIYPNVKHLASNLINEDETIAIRIPKEEFCQILLQTFGKPIVSTSANISGENTASTFKEISLEIKNKVDYVCDYRQDDEKKAAPSKILKWELNESLTIIRE